MFVVGVVVVQASRAVAVDVDVDVDIDADVDVDVGHDDDVVLSQLRLAVGGIPLTALQEWFSSGSSVRRGGSCKRGFVPGTRERLHHPVVRPLERASRHRVPERPTSPQCGAHACQVSDVPGRFFLLFLPLRDL